MIYASIYTLSALGIMMIVTAGYFLIFFFIIAISGWLVAHLFGNVMRFLRYER